MEKALLTGLIATVVFVVTIKWITGIALMPLLLVAIMVFGVALAFALRLDRANASRRQ